MTCACRIRTDHGYVEFELYITPRTPSPRRVAVLGSGGVQVVADIASDPEFAHPPWDSGQLQGEIRFAPLRQTTGRRGLQRDRRVFPCLVEAVQSLEAEIARRIERLNREQESQVDLKLARAVRQAFRRALSEIEALSTAGLKVKIADPAGPEEQGNLFDEEVAATSERATHPGEPDDRAPGEGDGRPRNGPDGTDSSGARPGVDEGKGRTRQSSTTGLNYRPVAFEDSTRRSRYNEALRTIEVNSIHPDYRRAKAHDKRCFLDYLVLLVAKELALLNYQGIDQGELLEKYAELMARVQLHLPKRL